MARPRVFVSSTYYDLRQFRERLERFIGSLGYEGVLSEHGDIPYDPDHPLDESCYKEVTKCHILVLIIGGRYGSPQSGESKQKKDDLEKHYAHYNSVTSGEYRRARDNDIPVYIFVEAGVANEYETFKRNRDNKSISYAHVENVNVFRLLDEIARQNRNNAIQVFEKYADIESWLQSQWAGLFANYLQDRGEQQTLAHMAQQLEQLEHVTNTLKTYSEAILTGSDAKDGKKIVQEQSKKDRSLRFDRFASLPIIQNLELDSGQPASDIYRLLKQTEYSEEFYNSLGLRQNKYGNWESNNKITLFEYDAESYYHMKGVFAD